MENRLLLLLLTLIPGIGPARIKAISGYLNDLSDVLQDDVHQLMQVPGIGEPLARQIHHFLHHTEKRQEAERAVLEQMAKLQNCGGHMVTMLDPGYPSLLREIYDPPPCLFVRGKLPQTESPGLAVVGTRQASQYGKECTSLLCRELVKSGFTIFSGLAFGIDMAAHTATLEQEGVTVAVLASGVDSIYTDPHGKLWPKIIERGAIISEEWIGSELTPGKFPKRNRLISGLTLGTIVVESDLKGGALITAATALEQNREVFAVPGSIFSRTSQGTNRLIQQGQAKAVMNADDILYELGGRFIKKAVTKLAVEGSTPSFHLTPEEHTVMRSMGDSLIHIDALAALTAMDVSTLLVHLFELELKSAIEQQPGQFFQKKKS